jgi:hypothetical protein
LDNCVVSSWRNALGPSWLVMLESFEDVVELDDDPVDEVPLLISFEIGRDEVTPDEVAMDTPTRGS